MSNPDFDPQKTLVILLGAEEWPYCPAIVGDIYPLGKQNPFRKSVGGIEEYFTKNLKIESDNLKSWFNSDKNSSLIRDEMTNFIKEKTDATYLFLYYVGHGTFFDDDYSLLLYSTKQAEAITSFKVKELFEIIRDYASELKCYIILDACFSGAAYKLLPTNHQKGVGVFYSCSKEQDTKVIKENTPFTKALLEVLDEGHKDYFQQQYLSFNELESLVNKTVEKIYADEEKTAPQAGFFSHQPVAVKNFKIFPNPKYDPNEKIMMKSSESEDTRKITWHIVTGGKGGVGKTLLSLFLVTYYHENLKRSPLIIDFNGVNTDLKRLINDHNLIDINVPIEEIDIDDNKLTICKIVKGKNIPYLLGWMNDPYKTYNPKSFLHFLDVLRKYLPQIQKKFEMSIDIDTVIIDTNYHFCNLFSRKSNDYSYFPYWKIDRFFIWFIWVYRQIQNAQQLRIGETDKLITEFNTDVNYMMETATMIEQQVSINYPTPFIHVINPMSLTESSIIREFVKMLSRQRSQVVPALHSLAQLNSVPISHNFITMFNLMIDAQIQSDGQNFSEMLEKLYPLLKTRPINLFPLDTHEKGLGDASNKIKKLQVEELQVYKTFSELFLPLLNAPNS